MAVATYTSDLVDIFLFETTTNVSAYGGGAAGLGASPDYAIEGTNAVDKQVSASEKGFMYDNTTNFSIGPNDHFFIWIIVGVPGLVDTRNNRGIHVSIGDDISNFVKFHVNGGDTLPKGGHNPYAIRYVSSALTNRRTLVGTPGSTPSWIGGGANITGTARFSNLGCDAARIGTGYDITGGTGADTEADFAGIASDDESTSEGVCQTADGGYRVQGKIRIGNSGTECEFLDSNINLFLVDTLDGESLTDFTEFIVSDDLSILTLTNVNFIALGTNNPGRFEMVTPLVTGQDETSYDNSPTTEGTFSGGTGHAVSDVITLDDDWTTVTVDAVSAGVVTQFTVNPTKGRSATVGTTLSQSSTTGSGAGFSLTPDTDNIVVGGTATLTNCGFIDFGVTILNASCTFSGCRWINAGIITADGANLSDSSILSFEGTVDTSPLVWDVNTDPDGKLDNMTFEKGTAATHAIEFGTNSPTTMTVRGLVSTGYNASNAQNDSFFHVKRTSGTVTINVIGGTGNFSYKSAGATVDIVIDPVTTLVNIKDNDGNNEQNVRVFLKAADGTGDLPFEESVTITRAGTTATVSHTGHGLNSNEYVKIQGITDKIEDNNGAHQITVTDANTYTYTTTDSGSTSYTGSIIATGALIYGLTDVNGNISSSRTLTLDQPLTGFARKSSSSPRFKTLTLSGTVDNATGLTINRQLILDE